jgi:Dolichyl-phosphate-mannose-protein mannosyltransferase
MTEIAAGAGIRRGWFGLLGLAISFLLLAYWGQRAFWLAPCPGQVGCGYQWPNLLWLFGIETGLCVGVVAIGATISRFGGADRTIGWISLFVERRATWLIALVLGVALLLPLWAAFFVLDRFPNSSDEFSYLFQAHAFAGFRLWEAPPVLGVDLIAYRTWIFESKWVSQYPPGWPIALAAGFLLGLPMWTVNALLGAASVAALAALCRRVGDLSATIVAVALYALTPFYVMNAASYFSHIISSLLIVLLCHCLLPIEAEWSPARLFAAGVILGLLAMTRYFDLPLLLPALLFWLATLPPTAWPRTIALMTAGFTPIIGLLAAYQYLITGSPFHSTYVVMSDAADPSVPSLSLEPELVLIGVMLTPVRLAELALWTSPIVLMAYLGSLWLKFKERTLAFYDLIFPSFVIAYVFFVGSGGNRYGPRYYMEAFPLLVVTIVSAAPSVLARVNQPMYRMLIFAPIACLLYFLAAWPLVSTGFRREVFAREEPFRLAREATISDAVVILETASAPGLVTSDLVRNPPTMDAAVLYARPDTDRKAVRQAFPTRSIWRYTRQDQTQAGELVEATP